MTSIEIADDRTRSHEQVRYPVNLRITIPFLPRSFFVTLIIGPEKRSRERLKEIRERYPINTWGNLATLVASWTVFCVAAFFVLLIATAL